MATQGTRKRETQIFIEQDSYRNDKLIAELCEVLSPNTMLSVAVDLTTPQEEIRDIG